MPDMITIKQIKDKYADPLRYGNNKELPVAKRTEDFLFGR
jgi:hypothetical protein